MVKSSVDPSPKPRFRGVSHFYACFLAAIAGTVLIYAASSYRAVIAAGVYTLAQTALFGFSALYHLPRWGTRAEPWMRRLDHAGIALFIAASYTPFCVLALGARGPMLLTMVWVVSGLGFLRSLLWNEAPPWVCASFYVAMGCMVVPYLPQLVASVGPTPVACISVAGLCYIVGAVVFSLRRPDPAPLVFGYHEIFHVFVIAGAAIQYGVVTHLVAVAQ